MSGEIRTPDEMVDGMREAIDGLCATFHARTVARDAAIARAIRAGLASADPLTLLAALASDLSPQGPETQPGPTEHTDMLLRYQYDAGMGLFAIPSEHGDRMPMPSSPASVGSVFGLRVRLVYSYSPADREAAEDVARVWEARLRERGAREVVCVGEEDGR